jgi:GH24 family phage-related lysozyme (muramidase)
MISFLDAALKIFDLDEGRGKPGREGMPYKDSKGFWTIGRGHFIGTSLENLKLSQQVVDDIFFEDLNRCSREARLVLGQVFFYQLSPARKMAILTLFFTMGADKVVDQFDDTIEAIKREDWENVADRIPNWKWAKDVDPKQIPGKGRDDRVIYMFRTGKFHPDYNIKEI